MERKGLTVAELEAELLKVEWTLTGRNGETRFFFERFGAVKGDEILDRIREQIGGSFDLPNPGGDVEAAFLKVLAALPRPFVKQLQATMFEVVKFSNRIAETPLVLVGNEETAFNAIGAKAIDLKHVLGRALAVNFFDSFSELGDLFSWLESPSSSPSTPTG